MANALITSCNEQIRPLLNAVNRLRRLEIIQEDIALPTIVVVGDQSSGKSSVLESLAGIRLPHGRGLCTRVPLIMQLVDDPSLSSPELHLQYKNKLVASSEADIAGAIESATSEIAGDGNGISDTPITLVVRKKGVPSLTMVELPGITWVPFKGQPENIYEQINGIIMKYIASKESIILNVLSAAARFPTCGSIALSKQADPAGERTLAVVTKADRTPEGVLEQIAANDVKIGLGYVCVRNRINSETFEEAREAESELFQSHHLLSKLDKSMVGVPVLAQRLLQLQRRSIAKCIPDIMEKINHKLACKVSEMEELLKNQTSADVYALIACTQIISKGKETLKKLLILGEYEDYLNDNQMHGSTRMAEMLDAYTKEMPADFPSKKDHPFLMEEMKVLEETACIGLPNFFPRTAFMALFQRKLKEVSGTPPDFVLKIWNYIEDVVLRVLRDATENHPLLQASTGIHAQNLLERKRQKSLQFAKNSIAMEMVTNYTSNPKYMEMWEELMTQQREFMEVLHKSQKPAKMNIKGVGEVDVSHLRGENAALAGQAFDMRMRLVSYWKCVHLRLVDSIALHVLSAVKDLVEGELEAEVGDGLVGGKGKLLGESPAVAGKRERLTKSISLLKESKEVVAKIMDKISAEQLQ